MGRQRLLLVRHGATTGESHLRFHGSADLDLSPLGCEQIAALAGLMEGVVPTRIFHSPMLRARRSLDILIDRCGWQAPVREIEDFREIHFGHCEGLTPDEIGERFPHFHARWLARGPYLCFPGGENLEAFSGRIAAATDRILAGVTGGTTLVVAHKGVTRRMLWHLLGRDHPEVKAYDPPMPAAVTLEGDGEGWTWYGLVYPPNRT